MVQNVTFFKALKKENKYVKSTTDPMFTPLKLTRDFQNVEAAAFVPSVMLVKNGQDNTISNIGEPSGKVEPASVYF